MVRVSLSRRHLSVMAALVLGSAVLAAGCGSSSDKSTASNPAAATVSSSGNAGVAEAQKFVDQHLAAPTSVGVNAPVAKGPPKGRSVVYLDCGVPVCGTIGDGVQAATAKLGWKFQKLVAGSVPEKVANAWQQVLQLHPDAVISAGIPEVLFAKQLARYAAAGGVYVGGSVLDPVKDGLIAVISGRSDYVQTGQSDARWVIADSKGKANTVLFTVPDFPVQVVLKDALSKDYKGLCPSCHLSVEAVAAASIGKDLPSQVVSYVQKNPDTNYIVMGFGDMTVGVPEALRAAGLADKVKIIAGYASPINQQHVRDGQSEKVTVAHPDLMSGWLMTDALVRNFTGTKLPNDQYEKLPFQYLTADSVGDPKLPYVGVQSYQQQFEKLWTPGG